MKLMKPGATDHYTLGEVFRALGFEGKIPPAAATKLRSRLPCPVIRSDDGWSNRWSAESLSQWADRCNLPLDLSLVRRVLTGGEASGE